MAGVYMSFAAERLNNFMGVNKYAVTSKVLY
jgi:hypothetical protein